MEHLLTIEDEGAIGPAAHSIIPLLNQFRIAAFYGSMGVGKTTFIKSLCRVMGVDDTVSSPSFALVNEYLTGSGEIIFHFDFYRLKSVGEVFDMGYEDYFYSDAFCFIEWPEKIADVLPLPRLDIFMEELEDGVRFMRIVEREGD